MTPQPTPHAVRSVTALARELTNATLGGCALGLLATDSRAVHAFVALALVVLLVLRLERTGGEG